MNRLQGACITAALLIGCGEAPDVSDRDTLADSAPVYRSPTDVAFSPDGKLAMLDTDSGRPGRGRRPAFSC